MTDEDLKELRDRMPEIVAEWGKIPAVLRSAMARIGEELRQMFVRVEGDHVLVLTYSGRYLRVPLNARDRWGHRAPLVRVAAPTPLYTRQMLGEHEAARDTRRERCRGDVVYRTTRT